MRSKLKLIVMLVVVVLIALIAWLVDYLFWFGADAPQIDYNTKIRELQADPSGTSLDDYRAHEALVELAAIVETLGEDEHYEPGNIDYDRRLDQQDPAVLAEIEEWISVCEQRGVFDKIDEFAALPGYVMDWDPSVLFIDLDYLEGSSALRSGLRVCGYRGRLALYAGESAQAIEDCKRQVGMAKLLLSQPIAINRLVGHASLAFSISYCRELLSYGVSADELVELMEVYDSVELHPIEQVIDGERLLAQNAITGAFTGNKTIKIMSRGAQWARAEHQFDRMQDWLQLSAFERARAPYLEPTEDWRYAPADILLPAMVGVVRSDDQIRLDLAAVKLEIAIERYRLDTGGLPASLGELVPNYIAEIPRDVFAEGTPELVYRVLDEPDEKGRDYHLYSVGHDGEDNGGQEPEKSAAQALDPKFPGTDFMLHDLD